MNFDRILKYLDLRRASKDETLVTKPLSIFKARPIKKVQDTLVLPTFVLTFADVSGHYLPRLIFQYNVTIGYEFSFDFSQVTTVLGPYVSGGPMFVKFRVGNVVTRYRLNVGGENVLPLSNFFPKLKQSNLDQLYVGQRIKSNCVFEFWLHTTNPLLDEYGLIRPLPLKLSRLRNPVHAEDVGTTTDAAAPLDIDDIGVAIPETLPYTQDNQVWLNNA